MRSVSIISKMTAVATTTETNDVTLNAPSIVKIKVDRADIASMQRSNQDLVIALKDGETVTIKNFYVTSDLGQSQLVLEEGNGALWWVQDTDGAFHFQQISGLEELLVTAEGGNEGGGAAWAWILGGAAAAAGIGIAASNSNGSGSHHHDDGGNGGTDPGNPQPPVDTTPPDAPTNLAISPDGKTITGSAEPGSTIIVRDPDGNIIGTGKTGDDGKFTVGLDKPQSNGEHLTVEAKDPSNNTGPTTPITAPDTTAPDAPTDLAVSNDGKTVTGSAEPGSTVTIRDPDGNVIGTGTAGSDGKFTVDLNKPQTNGEQLTAEAKDPAGNTSPSASVTAHDTTAPGAPSNLDINAEGTTLTGKAEAGSTVKVTDSEGNLLGTGKADANGNFTITLTAAQTDGERLSVTATDAAGNQSSPSSIIAPNDIEEAVNLLRSVVDDVGPVTGNLASGQRTDDTRPTFNGRGEPGTTINIFDNGVKIGSVAVGNDGTWSYTPTTPLKEGNHAIIATGSQTPDGSIPGFKFVVDTTPPTAPSGLTPSADGTQLSGKAEPGSLITIKDADGNVIGTGTTGSNGSFTITLSPAQITGEQLTVTARDSAGNTSPEGNVLSVDKTPPTAPEELIINATGSVLTGEAEPGSKITVKDSAGNTIASGVTDSNGNFSITLNPPLTHGEKLTATATDAANNTSAPGSITAPNFDVSNQPTILSATDDVAPDTGNVANNGQTNDTRPVLNGHSDAWATITIYEGQTKLGTVQADGKGNWSFPFLNSLNDGQHSFTAVATNVAGKESSASADFVLNIDTAVPDAPTISAVLDNEPGVVGAIENGKSTNDTTPTFNGTGEPGSTITVYNNSTILGTAKVDESGAWTFTPSTPLQDGTYAIRVTATDAAGNVSAPSGNFTFTVDAKAPDAPTFTAVIDNSDGTNVTVANGGATNDATPTITGKAEPGALVTLWATLDGNRVELGTATANAQGNWSITPGTPLAEGAYTLSVTATDSAGNVSPVTSEQSFTLDLSAPSAPGELAVSPDGNSVTGTAEANSTVTVKDANGTVLGSATADGDGNFTVTLDPVQDNSQVLSVTATDKAGNVSPPNGVQAPDLIAPDAPANLQVSDNGTTVTGQAEPGSTVTITDANGSPLGDAETDSDGNFSVTLTTPQTNGEALTAVATDKAGNPSDDASVNAPDITAPERPVLESVVDDVPATIGDVANGQSTNDARPTLNGTSEANAIVTIYDNNVIIGTATANQQGVWSFTPGSDLSSGSHSFTISAKDAAGNTSSVSDPFTINVDTTAPTRPTISSLTDDQQPTTGAVSSGQTTNDNLPVINGSGEVGSTVSVYDNGKLLGSAVVGSSGTWTLTLTTPLDEGVHNLTLSAADAAGNTTANDTPFTFTVDTLDPEEPIILEVRDDVGPDTGVLNDGDTTDDTRPTFSGKAEANAQVKIYEGDTLLGTANVDANGNWSLTPDAALDEGIHNFTFVTVDAAGNSGAETTFTLNVDTLAPEAPAIDTVNDNVGTLTGNLANNQVTDDTRPTLSGTGENGATITVYSNGVEIGSTTVVDGKWTFTPDRDLNDGENSLTVTATDAAGNVSAESPAFIINVDNDAPIKPVIGSVIDDVAQYTGALASGDITNDTRPTFNGTGVEGDTITLYNGTTVLGTAVVGEDGKWSITPANPLGEQTYTLHVTATDPAGNVSASSDNFVITVDVTPPAVPPAFSVEDNAGDDRGALQSGDRTDDNTPTLSGTAVGGSVVTIIVDGKAIGTTTASSQGDWSFTPSPALADGTHTLAVTATDPAGNTSQPTPSFTLTIDTTGPAEPIIGSIADDVGLITTNLTDGSYTDDTRPTFTGTAEANGTVIIFANGTEIGRADVNENGSWSFTPAENLALAEGDNVLTFQALDDLGNAGPRTDGLTLHVDSTPPGAPTNLVVADDGLTVSGQAEANSTVIIRNAEGVQVGVGITNGLGYFTAQLEGAQTPNSTLTVYAQDRAGNESVGADVSVAPPTEPTVPVIIEILDDVGPVTGPLNSGDSTNDSQPVINGTASLDAVVWVTIGDREFGPIATTNGAWTFTPPDTLVDGTYTISARAEVAGVSSAESTEITITIDTVAPDSAVILSVTDDVGAITGPIVNNGGTDDTQPTLRGTAVGSASVEIFNGTTSLGTATVNAQGNWSFIPTGPLANGIYNFTVVAIDAAGNRGTESNTWTVTIDNATPTAPTLTGVEDNVGNVLGPIDRGSQTDDTQPTLSGTTTPGSTVIIYDDNVEIGRVTTTDGNWSFTPTTPLGEGAHSLTLTTTNSAGNTSVPSDAFEFSVDTTAPLRPVLNSVNDNQGPVTGDLLNNQATNDATPTLSGSAEPNSTLNIFDNGSLVATIDVPASGTWSWTPTTPLTDSTHAFTMNATDAAGNVSATTPAFTITVDTAAPNQPSPITATDSTPPNIGAITEGQQTNETRPALSGTVEPNATVQILDNGSVIGTVKADANGSWSFTPGTALQPGNHQLTVTATDSAGNVSPSSPALSFVVDTVAPDAPTIVNASDNVGSITDTLLSGKTTDDATPTLNGTSEAYASVRILDNGVQIGTATADVNGNWSFTPDNALATGSHVFTAIATDRAGNTGGASSSFTLIVDTTAPTAPSIIQASDNAGTVQGTLLTNQTTDDTTPTLSGTGEAGAIVTIRDNGTVIGTAVVNDNNTWTFTPQEPLAPGGHSFTATATDSAGNASGESGNFVLTVDLTPPVAPIITGAVDDIGTIKGPIASGQVTDDTRPTLSGTGEIGATINVYDNNVLLGTTTVGSGGTWSFTPVQDLTTGSHNLTATATDPAGNTGPASGAWNVIIDTTAPNTPFITTVTDNAGSVTGTLVVGQPTDDTTPTLNGTAEANATVRIYDNGVEIGNVRADSAGNWTYTPTLAEGTHTLTARAVDAAGNTSSASAVTTVTVDLTPPAVPTDLTVNATGNIVTGRAEPGSTVTILSATGTVLGTGVTDGLGNFTATLTPAQVNGEALQARATDVAGNTGDPAGFNAPFTGLPAAPVITTIVDDVGPVLGNVDNNQSTNDNLPAISGTAQARATVNIYNNGTLLATVVANDAGAWSYTPTTPLTEGLHTLTATATNATGTSSPSTAINITVDTLAPDAPIATVSADGFTVSGTAEANSVISITVPGQAAPLTVTTDANGNWTLGLPTRLIAGEQVTAIATDAAGNISQPGLTTAPTLAVAANDNVVNLDLETNATVTSQTLSDYGFLLVGALGNVASVIGDDTAQVTFTIDAGGSGSAVIEAAATGAVLSLLNSLEIAVQKYDTSLQAWVTVIDTSLPQFANLLTLGASGVRLALDNLDGGQYRVLSFNTSLLAVGSYTSLDVSLVKTSAGTVTAGATENGNVITDVDPSSGGDVAPAGTLVTTIANASGTVTQLGANGADIAGKYGTLHINQDGSYTYTLTNTSVSVVGRSESFVYTIAQGGNSSSANLVITLGSTVPPSAVTAADDSATLQFDTSVAAVNNGPSSTTGFTLVGLSAGNVIDVGLLNNMQSPIIYNVEAGTTRTLSLGASVGGVAVGAVFDLYVYRLNPETGNYEQYRHVPSWLQAALLGGSTQQDLVITLPDGKYLFTLNAVSGLTVVTGFTLNVNDDHTYSVKSSTASTSGEVLDNDAGAANGHVTEVNGVAVAANGTTTINGQYGTLTIDAQGHYTYTLKSGLGADSIKTPDSFVYTVTAANGDTSKASLNVQATAKPVDAINDISSTMALATTQVTSTYTDNTVGSATIASGGRTATGSGTFEVADGAALKAISVTFNTSTTGLAGVGGLSVAWSILENGQTVYTGTTLPAGTFGLLNGSRTVTLSGFELDAGTYTLAITTNLTGTQAGGVTVTPVVNATAYDLDNFLINNAAHTVTGNIYNGHDSAGAVDQIASAQTILTVTGSGGSQSLNPTTDSNGAATIQGTYGSLRIAIDGSYTYTLKAGLHPGDITTKETFTYTLNDQKGHSDSATLTINMNPQFTSTSQSDVIHGSAYGDTLVYDLLNNADNRGGNGSDRWDNFSLAQGDKIDIGDLLVGWNGQQSSLGNYLSVTTSGNNTVISIDRDGTGTAHSSTTLITLENVQTTLNELIEQNHIVT